MSEDILEPLVTEMPRASVTPDGSIAVMEMRLSDGSSQTLRFSPKTMMSLVNRVFELFVNQMLQTAKASGHLEVQPLPAVATSAQEAVGGEKVILSVRMETGLPVSFSVDPAEAEELHRQLGKAVKKARRQSSAKRH